MLSWDEFEQEDGAAPLVKAALESAKTETVNQESISPVTETPVAPVSTREQVANLSLIHI